MERAVTLLEALSSLPPEQLVEGAELVATLIDGSQVTITLGPRIPAPEPLFQFPCA